MTVDAAKPDSVLRVIWDADPAVALGLAVSYLMTKPAFARLPFGMWCRILVGQVNRRTYFMAMDGTGRIVGFVGWALTDEQRADAWLGGQDVATDHATGDCVIINAWSADTPKVHQLLLNAARNTGIGHRLIYFKRHYADGRTRRARLAARQVQAQGRAVDTKDSDGHGW